MLETGSILFGRVEHGADHVSSVRVLDASLKTPKFELLGSSSTPGQGIFESRRSLMIALTGHRNGRNWTFDRYFGLGRWASPSAGEGDLGEVLGWSLSEPKFDPISLTVTHEVRLLSPLSSSLTVLKSQLDQLDTRLSVGTPQKNQIQRPSAEQVAKRVLDQNGMLGIDLVGRADEVASLLFSGFGSWIYSSGYDAEDVLQEVYKGMLARNVGKCPWDASKSSFGHYVHMVCSGVVSNFHRKQKRTREIEQLGVKDMEGGMTDVSAAGLPASETSESWSAGLDSATLSLIKHIKIKSSGISETQLNLMVRVIPLLRDGHTKAEIADKLGASRPHVSKAVEAVQKYAHEWYFNV